VLGNVSDEDMANPSRLCEIVLPYLNESYGDQKTTVEELQLLQGYYEAGRKEEEKKKKEEKLGEVVQFVKDSGKIIDIENIRIDGRPLNDDMKEELRRNEKIKIAEFATQKDVGEFVLHKDCLTSAIDYARKLFRSTKNDRDIQILGQMKILDMLDPKLKKEFEGMEAETLFEYLPFFTWIWRAMFGSKKVHKFEAEEIRAKLAQVQADMKIKHKKRQITQEREKLAKESLREKEEKEKQERTAVIDEDDSAPSASVKSPEEIEKENEEKETLENIVNIIDAAWDAKQLPDRAYVLERLGKGVTEDQLMFLLKKHASKNIFSYQIRNQPEKYRWPILITRKYVRANGNRLLNQVKKTVDKQKEEMMPNQEQFDVAISLENFLVRLLPKLAK